MGDLGISNHEHNVLGYFYKIIRPVSDKRNCEATKDRRVEFVEWIMQQNEDEVNKHFVFIDQSGFYMNKFKRRICISWTNPASGNIASWFQSQCVWCY